MNELNNLSLARAERLSALYDGEIDPGNPGSAEASDFCREVARDDGLAARWASYALIGDALRSPDLIRAPAMFDQGANDQNDAFVRRMRAALAAEPVVLVPAAALHAPNVVQTTQTQRPWVWAAGFASVTLAAAVAWNVLPQRADEAQLAASAQKNAITTVAVKSAATATTANNSLSIVQTANGNMIRDARLDQYFIAHHRIGGAAVAPAGFVRNAAVQAPACAEC